jgi:hypothetical protein
MRSGKSRFAFPDAEKKNVFSSGLLRPEPLEQAQLYLRKRIRRGDEEN